MKLGEFARIVGAPPKWIQNASAVLGISFGYTLAEAQRVALARALVLSAGIPLKRAYALADEAFTETGDLLSSRPGARQLATHLVLSESADGAVRLELDLDRFRSAFIARLSATRNLYGERRRGRRPLVRERDPIRAAEDWGVDMSLLEDSSRKTPAERLREMDENSRALREITVSE